MAKFDFTKEQMEKWKDEEIFLRGTKDVGVVLFHGWSSFPREVAPLAQYLNKQGYWVSAPRFKGHGTQPEELEGVGWQEWLEEAKKASQEMKNQPGVKKVVVGGASMGGSLALLVSQKMAVAGIVTLGTPVHLRNHLGIWLSTVILPKFKPYVKKNYPKSVKKEKDIHGYTSYLYFPILSVKESLKAMHEAVFSLAKVTAPILILQTSSDYLVAKYSPWVIYNLVSSKIKEFHWIKSSTGGHIILKEGDEMFGIIEKFISKLE